MTDNTKVRLPVKDFQRIYRITRNSVYSKLRHRGPTQEQLTRIGAADYVTRSVIVDWVQGEASEHQRLGVELQELAGKLLGKEEIPAGADRR